MDKSWWRVLTKCGPMDKGMANHFSIQYCLENPMNHMKRPKDRALKIKLPRQVGTQYATRDQWRANSKKNEEMEPKQTQHQIVDVTGDESKVRGCKEQYCQKPGMNQGMNLQ